MINIVKTLKEFVLSLSYLTLLILQLLKEVHILIILMIWLTNLEENHSHSYGPKEVINTL